MSSNYDLENFAAIAAGQTSPEDALSAGNYPASGSYIDVSGYTHAACLIHMGAIHANDDPVFELKETDSTTGTLDTLSATYAKVTLDGTDDDEFVLIQLDLAVLSADHHYLSCVVSGVGNGSYGDIVFLLFGGKKQPVTHVATVNTVRYYGQS